MIFVSREKQKRETKYMNNTPLISAKNCLSTAVLVSGFFWCYAASADGSGSDYVPGAPIKFGSSPSAGLSSGAPSGSVSSPSSTPSDTTEATPAESASASGERGLGSLFRGVKHELRNSGLLNGVGSQGNQYNNSNTYQGGSGSQYASPNWSQGGSQLGNGAPLNYVRQSDGTYRANGPNIDQHGRYHVQQTAAAPSGDLMQYVSSPPMAVDGDIENLIPAELHNYAYGKELPRNAPLNGAEGYAGNF